MKKVYLVFLSAVMTFVSCQKLDMTSDVDFEKYETQLKEDYDNAFLSHKTLTVVSSDSHASHHTGTSASSSSNPALMFSKSDSLFSEHFYEFCLEMMKDDDHMSSDGMMDHSGMMGDKSEMMGGDHNMDEMAEMMTSHHDKQSAMMSSNYYAADSIMYAKMAKCEMMNRGTEGIAAIYNKMQDLRLKHRSLHGNF